MKLKKDVDLAELLSRAKAITLWDWGERKRMAKNWVGNVLEFEEEDFENAINVCRFFKYPNIVAEVERDFELWKSGNYPINPACWFEEILLDNYRKKSTLKRIKFKNSIRSTFKEELKQINDYINLFALAIGWKFIQKEYEVSERQMKKVMELINSGFSPADFKWSLVEPLEEEEESSSLELPQSASRILWTHPEPTH